jgi:hypothetical protein
MTTKITNLEIPELFGSYFSEQSVVKNAFIRSGIVTPSEQLTALIANGGFTGRLPFFKFITGDSEVLNEASGLTPVGNTAEAETYAVLARGKAFAATDLAKAFSGSDPLGAMADQVSDYWTGEMSKILVSSLTGLFSDTTMTGLVNDITAGGDAPSRTLNASTFVDSCAKLGDAASKLSVLAVHSATFAKLVKEQLITYLRSAEFDMNMPFYLGKLVLIDDSLPVGSGGTAGQYTSYVFTPGSVVYGGNVAPVPVETARDALTGVDMLITRYHMVMHPRGASIDLSGIGASLTPSNAELAGDIWTRVFETKNMGIVQIKHLNA